MDGKERRNFISIVMDYGFIFKCLRNVSKERELLNRLLFVLFNLVFIELF